MRRLLAVVALATLAACDTFKPVRDATVAGTWRGTSGGQTFVLVMQQQSAVVAGSGTVTGTAAGSRNLSISGTFNQPAFSATLTPVGEQGISILATVEDRSMVGTLTGNGFNGDGIALTRD